MSDVEGCFELQCNQVFIGMVTMQYQAQIDMVCIVHWPYCRVLVPSFLPSFQSVLPLVSMILLLFFISQRYVHT